MILDSDPRIQASLPKSGEPQACGCAWRTLKTWRGEEKIDLFSVCLLHRRWLRTITTQMRSQPTSFHASVKLVGPAYQHATRHGAGGHTPESMPLEAHPQQMGGSLQMDGPLYQASRDAARALGAPGVIEEPEPTVEEIIGFDPNKIQEEKP